jgi:hypothetical protein
MANSFYLKDVRAVHLLQEYLADPSIATPGSYRRRCSEGLRRQEHGVGQSGVEVILL